ncbi:MAG: hypothetical protein ACRDJH_03540 [Thermomicrobiales bacterium]
MTTRLDLRTTLRRRLEDTGITPLWDDAALNDALADAVRHYGTRFPKEATTTVMVPAGSTSIPVTPPIPTERVLRLFDDEGAYVPRQTAFAPETGVFAQSWRWWNSSLNLTQAPATTGNWTVEHLTGRSLPADDVTAVDLIPGDEEMVTLLATVTALRRRTVEDAKRGSDRSAASVAAIADRAERAASWLIAARRRRAHGGWLA